MIYRRKIAKSPQLKVVHSYKKYFRDQKKKKTRAKKAQALDIASLIEACKLFHEREHSSAGLPPNYEAFFGTAGTFYSERKNRGQLADRRFHTHLVTMVHNVILQDFQTRLINRMSSYLVLSSTLGEEIAHVLEEHQPIVDTMASENYQEAL